jgi:DNA-binding XRE family transcriptional regulator
MENWKSSLAADILSKKSSLRRVNTITAVILDIYAIIVYYIIHYKNGGDDVSKKAAIIMPKTREILEQMGEQMKLARLRRKLSSQLVAERAGISRQTLNAIENGSSTVSIGSYAAVLHALNNLDTDLLLIAKDDEFGRKLQDLDLPTRKRAPKKGDS